MQKKGSRCDPKHKIQKQQKSKLSGWVVGKAIALTGHSLLIKETCKILQRFTLNIKIFFFIIGAECRHFLFCFF